MEELRFAASALLASRINADTKAHKNARKSNVLLEFPNILASVLGVDQTDEKMCHFAKQTELKYTQKQVTHD